jgi:hypothetical protein
LLTPSLHVRRALPRFETDEERFDVRAPSISSGDVSSDGKAIGRPTARRRAACLRRKGRCIRPIDPEGCGERFVRVLLRRVDLATHVADPREGLRIFVVLARAAAS